MDEIYDAVLRLCTARSAPGKNKITALESPSETLMRGDERRGRVNPRELISNRPSNSGGLEKRPQRESPLLHKPAIVPISPRVRPQTRRDRLAACLLALDCLVNP